MATAYLNNLSSFSQPRKESILNNHLHARLFVIHANPNLAHPDKMRIFVTSYMLVLYDLQLAAFLAVVKIENAANA